MFHVVQGVPVILAIWLVQQETLATNIEFLQGTNLTVECVADTFNPSVQYSWTHPSGTGVGRSEYFSLLYSGNSL